MYEMGIGKKIKQLREKQNFSQEQLAEAVKISVNYLSAIERGVKIPKFETFIKIINCLFASADEVLTDVLLVGNKIKNSALNDRIGKLQKKEQERIQNVLTVLIEEAEKGNEELC